VNILGIIGFGENPAACLLRDGKITSFVEEERFTRLKGSDGLFPKGAVTYCLTEQNLTLQDIDFIAFGWDSNKYPWEMLRGFTFNYLKYRSRANSAFQVNKKSSSIITAFESIVEFHPDRIKAHIQEGLRDAGFFGKIPEIKFVNHHLAHAYSSYFCSPFQKAGILTIDGSGEDMCTQLYIAEGEKIKVVESYPIPHSLGWFYAAITQYLGFTPYRDEGKVMGLAALGESRRHTNKWCEPLSKILKITTSGYEIDPIYTKVGGHFYGSRFTDAFYKLLTDVDALMVPVAYGEKAEKDGEVISKYLLDNYIDLAWAAQRLLEKAAVSLAKKLVNNYGVENICLAGGVAMNCKMNGEVLRQSGCKEIFVQPASSDGGTALGAAMIVAQQVGDNIRNPLNHTYYGPEFSNAEIKSTLDMAKVDYEEVNDPAELAAGLLEEGKMVSWFQGRMEFGARALGGRSILASPVFPEIKLKVNKEVKYREDWRPFCPSMIKEVSEKYLVDPGDGKFMIVACPIKQDIKEQVPSIVHVDDTVRPQLVSEHVNPLFHSLISNLGKKTGSPVVLNTSFNVRSEPIICTPLEAVRCFYSNGLDALIVGNFLLKKK
jgi:carbamoyltransferase